MVSRALLLLPLRRSQNLIIHMNAMLRGPATKLVKRIAKQRPLVPQTNWENDETDSSALEPDQSDHRSAGLAKLAFNFAASSFMKTLPRSPLGLLVYLTIEGCQRKPPVSYLPERCQRRKSRGQSGSDHYKRSSLRYMAKEEWANRMGCKAASRQTQPTVVSQTE